MLYAFTSATAQQRSAPSPGLTGEHALLQHARSALAMLIGRFAMIVPMLAVAGSLAAKKQSPALARHLPDPRRRCSSACWSA